MRIHSTALSFIWKLAIMLLGGSAIALRLGALTGSLDVVPFHYFSLLIAIAAVIYWLCDGICLLVKRNDPESSGVLEPSLKYAITMCSGIVLAATHFILRIGPFYGDGWDYAFVVLHYALPLMMVLDWLLFDRKGLMHAYGPAIWTFPILLYLLVTELLVCGLGLDLGGDFAISGVGRYPYPFLDASAKNPLHVAYLIGMGYLFFTALGYIVFAVDRLLSRVGRDAREAQAAAEKQAESDIQPPLSAGPRHFRS